MTDFRDWIDYPYDRRTGVPRPLVPVRIAQPSEPARFRNTFGLVDSGADGSLFHVSFALTLGLPIDPSEAVRTGGTAGDIDAWFHDVTLTVAERRFPARVGFVDNPRLIRFGVLGRQDLFRVFRVAFDERAQMLYLNPYDEPEG